MPPVDVILIEVPDEVGGYGAKGVGEIGCVATAGAVAGALHSYDGIRRFTLPMDDAPAAAPMLPKSAAGHSQDLRHSAFRRGTRKGMRAFDFFAAKDSSDAVALLAQHGPSVKVIAGGTDLLADLKFSSHTPRRSWSTSRGPTTCGASR